MTPEISFFVDGIPRAKQSFRARRRGGGYTPAHVKAWQLDVAWRAQEHLRSIGMRDLLDGHLVLDLTFFLPNARRIDFDNLSKCVADGLNGVAWRDDQQNIDASIHKYICRKLCGVLIRISRADRPLEVSAEQAWAMITSAERRT